MWKAQLDFMRRHSGWPDDPAADLLSPAQLRYLEMTGSAFITHGPIEPFTLTITDPAHPITQGVAAFELTDELYQLGGQMLKILISEGLS